MSLSFSQSLIYVQDIMKFGCMNRHPQNCLPYSCGVLQVHCFAIRPYKRPSDFPSNYESVNKTLSSQSYLFTSDDILTYNSDLDSRLQQL